jgi:hypothetical protein
MVTDDVPNDAGASLREVVEERSDMDIAMPTLLPEMQQGTSQAPISALGWTIAFTIGAVLWAVFFWVS